MNEIVSHELDRVNNVQDEMIKEVKEWEKKFDKEKSTRKQIGMLLCFIPFISRSKRLRRRKDLLISKL